MCKFVVHTICWRYELYLPLTNVFHIVNNTLLSKKTVVYSTDEGFAPFISPVFVLLTGVRELVPNPTEDLDRSS